jgi:hypothetical protein
MSELMRYAHVRETDEATIADALIAGVGPDPATIVMFYGSDRPGASLSRRLAAAYPKAALIGCMGASELSTGQYAAQSVVAAGLPRALVKRAAVACADYSEGLERGIERAVRVLEQTFGRLSALDPATHVGLIFLDSNHAIEERTHVVLGNHAPLLPFVGGSSCRFGFDRSEIVTSTGATTHGCGLMVLELACPFHVSRSCHFGPTSARFIATRVEGRLLHELNGRPAAEVYAEYVGVARPSELNYLNLMPNPIGLLIDGEAWLRQVWPPIQSNGTIHLGCAVAEGSELYFMKPKTDLVTSMQAELAGVARVLGRPRGALFFDCVGRRSELEVTGTLDRYMQLPDFPMIGFNTAGESWIGHMAQTLTALYFG